MRELEQQINEGRGFTMVTLSNVLAKKYTAWSLNANKLFLMGLANIDSVDSEFYVSLQKKEVMEYLGLGQNYSELRKTLKNLASKSYVQFGNDEEFTDGFLIYKSSTKGKKVKLGFSPEFAHLLKDLKGLYTWFYLENVHHFKSKFSLQLYQKLRSEWNADYMINTKKLYTKDLFEIFGLEMGVDYVRKNGGFDRYNFEKKTLGLALNEINEYNETLGIDSGLHIYPFDEVVDGEVVKKKLYNREKDKKGNTYYVVKYARTRSDEEGNREIYWKEPSIKTTPFVTHPPDVAEGQTTMDDF